MIRNYQKNGGIDINLTPIYQSLNSLKDNIVDLESLTTLNSLTGDIWSLSTNLDAAWVNITGISAGIDNVLLPLALSHSSAINSLSSSLTNLTDLTSLRTLTSYGNDISNLNLNTSILNDSINDLSTLSSLTTLNGVYTANSFNNQAFNTTFGLNSDMFFTGQFGLNSGSINCNNGIWDLKELKKTFLGSVAATSLSKLKMENFDLSYCDLSCNGNCSLEDCNLTQCQLTGNHAKIENGIVKNCWFDCKMLDFYDDMIFSNNITLNNGGNITFNNINFTSTANFKFNLSSGYYHILFSNCSVNNLTVNSSYYSGMMIERAAAHISYTAINNI